VIQSPSLLFPFLPDYNLLANPATPHHEKRYLVRGVLPPQIFFSPWPITATLFPPAHDNSTLLTDFSPPVMSHQYTNQSSGITHCVRPSPHACRIRRHPYLWSSPTICPYIPDHQNEYSVTQGSPLSLFLPFPFFLLRPSERSLIHPLFLVN